MPKIGSILASFWKPEACGQTVLPDRSVLIGQKLVESAKIEKFKCDILSYFQTMCIRWNGEDDDASVASVARIRKFFCWSENH